MQSPHLPLPQLLYRSLWPFWLFKDASRGDPYARAAAYRHNRRMRVNLPKYLLRWVAGCCLALAAIHAFEAQATPAAKQADFFSLMAAGSGIVFGCAACVVFVIAYVYLYLGQNGR